MKRALPTLKPAIPTVQPRVRTPAKEADSIYKSKAWLGLMRMLKRQRGNRCQDCGATGVRIIGDHIHELRDGGAPLDPDNIRLRCVPCHNTKTAHARRLRVLE